MDSDVSLCNIRDLERINTNANRRVQFLEKENENLKVQIKRLEHRNKTQAALIDSLRRDRDALEYINEK